MSRIMRALIDLGRRFGHDRTGSGTVLVGIAIVPLLLAGGAALDYFHASAERARLQAALDAALFAGARDGSATWASVAANAFAAKAGSAYGASARFSTPASGTYTGTATATIPTGVMQLVGITTMPVQVSATAATANPDRSCIVALGSAASPGTETITFNGSPNVKLTNCTIQSNASLTCNGHDTGALASLAAGTSRGCSNGQSSAPPVQDIWAVRASQIGKLCGSRPGAVWTPGTVPSAPNVITVNGPSAVEYHVCGDLTLSGTGSLIPGGTEAVVVIENGRLKLADNASIQANTVTFVLTGDNTVSSAIQFPNGSGKTGTLSISPPTRSNSPWRGISVYQDPALTTGVDEDWGPGAAFNLEGLVYLPNANVTIHGASSLNNPLCAKLVVKTLVTDGSVNLNQSMSGCSSLGVPQWQGSLRLSS